MLGASCSVDRDLVQPLEQAPAARWTDTRSHSNDDDDSSSGSDGSDGSNGSNGSGSGSRRRNNS